jgi:hypothetical protein
MEAIITAYSFGILTVVLIGAVVYGIKLNKKVKELEVLSNANAKAIDETNSDLHRRIDETDHRICDIMDRNVDDIYNTMNSRLDKFWNKLIACNNGKKIEQEENLSE